MTSVWLVIALLAVGTFLIKATGPATLGEAEMPKPLAGTVALLVPALLTALILEQSLGSPDGVTLDARVVGVVGAVVALALRLPLVWVLVVAAGSTALARLAF